MKKISVALATYNEEKNIGDCLKSVKDIADEIVIVDGMSNDRTVEIAKSYDAKVIQVPNDPMFHNMKQKAFDLSEGDWILYLDADERVTKKLAEEIKKIINMTEEELEKYQLKIKNRKLFLRHQKILEERDGKIGSNGFYSAFFFPRLNYFLGKYLRFGGVYHDGVIRLFKKGKALLPCKDVHEQLVVDGKVGWLQNDLMHFADPTFQRYLGRNSRYIDLITDELKREKVKKNPWQFLNYLMFKPLNWFLLTQIRHKGILDGFQGIVFSFFSALRFPRAYLRYLKK
ncbi:glycosyltransferase family 2 protein [Patescibacteria group bacterium]|nr:glycosyltransferase family 2 protein [Patescibacteria group bacterium]